MPYKYIVPINENANEEQQKRFMKERVKEYLNETTIKDFPDLLDILETEFRERFLRKTSYHLEKIYYECHSRYSYYGVLEKDSCSQFGDYFVECIYEQVVKDYDYDIILENDEYLINVFNFIDT
tara:strand:+ start:819 stop:1190 length:372 start_codon:yes stop_codon:yes gene_type:complete